MPGVIGFPALACVEVEQLVGAPQQLHFDQIFAIAKKWGKDVALEFVPFGSILGSDRKMLRTREGGTVQLADVLEEAVERAYKVVDEKNPEFPEEEKKEIAEVIGIGSVKYAELSQFRMTDYIFDWDTMLSFEGNTAPYLLYAYARIRSIFRKDKLDADAKYQISIEEQEEKALALKLLQFNEVVDQVAEDCYPNQLCLYLYELAGTYMKFYEACPVLKAEPAIRNSRLGLCYLTARTIKEGLALLGIETLEKM